MKSGRVGWPWPNGLQDMWHPTLFLGLGPLFLCGLGANWASGAVLAGLCDAPFTAAAAAAASAAAFNRAMVWDLGRRPRTPLRTGKGGKGWGNRYDVCMDEEELAEERRVVREVEVEDTGASRAPGRVTGTDRPMMWCYSILYPSSIVQHCGRIWR